MRSSTQYLKYERESCRHGPRGGPTVAAAKRLILSATGKPSACATAELWRWSALGTSVPRKARVAAQCWSPRSAARRAPRRAARRARQFPSETRQDVARRPQLAQDPARRAGAPASAATMTAERDQQATWTASSTATNPGQAGSVRSGNRFAVGEPGRRPRLAARPAPRPSTAQRHQSTLPAWRPAAVNPDDLHRGPTKTRRSRWQQRPRRWRGSPSATHAAPGGRRDGSRPRSAPGSTHSHRALSLHCRRPALSPPEASCVRRPAAFRA